MPLTLVQRRERLRTRIVEIVAWRVREAALVEGWSCDGVPIALGAPWPDREGVRHFTARANAPSRWPVEETRLSLDVGGESLLTLSFDAASGRASVSTSITRNFR